MQVTKSMVGLVATAVCFFVIHSFSLTDWFSKIESILADWETGTYDSTSLISNSANIVYKGHIIFLKDIHIRKPKGYHYMLRTLFYMARYVLSDSTCLCLKLTWFSSNGHVYTAATAAAAECMQVLSLNDMPEDSGPSEDEEEDVFY